MLQKRVIYSMSIMENQEQYVKEIEEKYATMTLAEEDGNGVEYDDLEAEEEGVDTRWALVGRFLLDIPINVDAMKDMMA